MLRWKKFTLWLVPLLAIFAVAGWFVARAVVNSYLRSERFHAFFEQKAGGSLQAKVEAAPWQFDGGSLAIDGLNAHGTSAAGFSHLQLAGGRADLSFRRIFARVWRVDQVNVERAEVRLNGPRIELPPMDSLKPAEPSSTSTGWLPNRIEIGAAHIHEADLIWQDGGLRGTSLQLKPSGDDWTIEGTGGKIQHGRLPPLDLVGLSLRYRKPLLVVNSAEFRQGTSGSVIANGEIHLDEGANLKATLTNIPLTPYLAEDWRMRLKGDISGQLNVRCQLPLRDSPEITGSLGLINGELEALPFLDSIAMFTHTEQFRRLKLSRATGEISQSGTRFTAKNVILESEGLIRIEGAFVIEASTIDGSFQVGVKSESLQWLPGSQTVFTTASGAYVWTPMRLTGPVATPKEDLTPRLAAAAAGTMIEQADGRMKDAAQSAKEAAQGIWNFLSK